jgi:signal transduction histidine kinase
MPLVRSLWFRVALGSSVVLVATLSIVVITVHQLTLSSERRELDSTLRFEGQVIEDEIIRDLQSIVESQGTTAVNFDDLEIVIGRSLARHPGSPVHLTLVRIDDLVLSSSRGPLRLTQLRDVGMLPSVPPGSRGSVEGIRFRSTVIKIGDLDVVIEALGDDAAIVDGARDIVLRTLIAAAIGGLIGLAGLTFAVHRSTRGLRAVSATVRRTRLEDLSIRVPAQRGTGEVSQLAGNVNAMLDELESARSAKDQLIASVSHELRTPLAAARGHMDLLTTQRSADPDKTLIRIDREIERITRLVEDLLALSRSGDSAWLSRTLIHVGDIVSELQGRLPALDAQYVRIDSPPDVFIEVDADRVLQALTNLVSNATMHTPSGTEVSVTFETSPEFLTFVVSDTGPGIPADVLERFGQAFVRGSSTGTGLGLAVTRAVALAHGGRLDARSDGAGTEIRISFPFDASPNE